MSYQGPDPLSSILRGMQIRSMVEEIKARREARSQSAQLHQLQIEQHQRQQQADEFNMRMGLAQMGALPPSPGDTGQNDELISQAVGGISPENRRVFAQTPVGNYRLPSQTDLFRRAQEVARQKGELARQTKEAEDPSVDIAVPEAWGGGGTRKVPQSKELDYRLKMFQQENPNMNISVADDKVTGDRTFFGTDTRTGKVKVLDTFPKVARPAASGAGGLTPHQQFVESHTLFQEDEAESKDIQKTIDSAQEKIAEATRVDAATNKATNPKTGPEWKAAQVAAQNAAKRYPWAIQATVDENGYPGVKDIRGEPWAPKRPARGGRTEAATAAPSAPASAGAKPKVVRSSQLEGLLKHPDVRARGITSINALRKDLAKNGYEIVED